MATLIVSSITQSTKEKRQWDFDFNNDLPTGATVSSAVATHTPPSGNALTPTVGSPVAGVVPVTLDFVSQSVALGQHQLSCVATFSNAEKSEILLYFRVDF